MKPKKEAIDYRYQEIKGVGIYTAEFPTAIPSVSLGFTINGKHVGFVDSRFSRSERRRRVIELIAKTKEVRGNA